MDLPNIRRKPTYEKLLHTLWDLQKKPTSWDVPSPVEESADDATILKFLMSVIASELDWFTDLVVVDGPVLSATEQKENLLHEASRRVAERCGRSGVY